MTDITGNNGNDLLNGTSSADAISGGNGSDVINGGDGADTLSGDNGSDQLDGGAGNDNLSGGNGGDYLAGGSGSDTLSGDNGDDVLVGGAGNDALDGGNGEDTAVYSGAISNYLFALLEDGGIRVYDTTGADGDDIVYDVSYFQFATGTVNAADLPFGVIPDPDTVDYSWTALGVNVDLTANTATGPEIGNETLLASIVNVIGGSGNDIIIGGVEANHLVGNGGDDILAGGPGDDTLDGGSGFDTARYALATSAVTVDLAAGTATGGAGNDTLISIERVVGSDYNDTLRGDAGNNTLEGGAGDDFLGGGAGSDVLDGGAGFDTAAYGLATGPITADLAAGTVIAGPDTDTLISIEAINGSAFNDILRGNAADNTLNGNDGNDFLVGRGGNDTLNGGNGLDIARFSGLRSEYMITPGGVPGSSTVTDSVIGRNGTDTLTGIELTEFDNTYVLNQRVLDLSAFGGLAVGKQILGTNLNNAGVGDSLTLGLNANGRFIDLGGGGTDSLTLNAANATYNLNLANVEKLTGSFGVETINMNSVVTNNMLVDMSFGFGDTLDLANGNNTVTVTNVENVNAFGGTNAVTFLHNDFTAGQSFNLGFSGDGQDTLILAGSDSTFNISVGGDATVVGATDSGNETVNLLNVQGGTTFDLGAGTDTLNLYNDGTFVNVVSVRNVENVNAVGFDSDQIHILGNSGGVTTVTAGGGADQIWASNDVDHFRYTTTGDSPYDIPGGGQRDVVHGFDAAQDKFVFDGIPGTSFTWEVTNFGGADIVRVDFDGDASWDMAIEVSGLVGTLTNANFEWIV